MAGKTGKKKPHVDAEATRVEATPAELYPPASVPPPAGISPGESSQGPSEAAATPPPEDETTQRRLPKKPAADHELAQVELKQRLKEMAQALKDRERELNQLRQRQAKLEQIEARLKEQHQHLLDAHKAEVRQLREELNGLNRALHDRNEQLNKLTAREHALRQAESELGRQLAELREEHEEAIRAFQGRVAEYEAVERELRAARDPSTEASRPAAVTPAENLPAAVADDTIRQLEEQLSHQTEREHDLIRQIDVLSGEHGAATAALTEARQQLEEHRQQFQAIRVRFSEYQRERTELLAQITHLREQLARKETDSSADETNVAATAEPLDEEQAAQSYDQPPWPPSRPLTAAAAGLVVAASLVLGAVSYWGGEWPEHWSAQIVVSDADVGAIQEAVRLAKAEDNPLAQAVPHLQVRADASVGMIELSLPLVDRNSDAARLDALGTAITEQLNREALPPPTVAPVDEQPFKTATLRLQEMLNQLGALAAQPAEASADKAARAIEGLRRAIADRNRLSEQIAELSRQMTMTGNSMPESDIQPDSNRIAEAEQADQVFQSDLMALRQRESYLVEMLQRAMNQGQAGFEILNAGISDAEKAVQKLQEGTYSNDVVDQMTILHNALADWNNATQSLADVWKAEWRKLIDPDAHPDPLASLARLQPAIRSFTETAMAAQETIQRSLEAIAQGGDQPTTRLVLRNRLAQGIQPAVEAREQVAKATRSVQPSDSPELAAMIQTVSGLRERAERRRAAILTVLREEAARKVSERHEQTLSRLRTQKESLAAGVSELDHKITSLAEVVEQEAGSDRQQRGAWLDQLNRLGEQLRAVPDQLAQAHQATRQTVQVSPMPIRHVAYVPARIVTDLPAQRDRLQRAGLLGSIPLAAAAIFLMIARVVRGREETAFEAWRQTEAAPAEPLDPDIDHPPVNQPE